MANVTVIPEAQAELDEAYARYRSHSERVADDFLDEVLDAFRKIADSPELWPIDEDDDRYRFFVLDRHSYVINYRIQDAQTVRVVAVTHSARRRGYWKGR
jgi:plasmid stabilization system protein ParE